MFNNKSILITGGTGSFGKKITNKLISKYKCKKIVITSGMWSREVGKMCGVNIPLHACEHFYALTEFSEDIIKSFLCNLIIISEISLSLLSDDKE